MKIGALSILKSTNSRGAFNLASYHSQHSLTWSWIVSIRFDRTWRKPNGWVRLGFHPHRNNAGLQVVVTLPFVIIQRHRQREMWFHDMYRRARDREDLLEGRVRSLRRELESVRAAACAGTELAN